MRKYKFDDFMRYVEAEARGEGQQAVDQLEAFREYFRLAREIIEARKAKGLSQHQLAKRCGIHQSEISDIERGRANPTFQTLQMVARQLNRRIALVSPTNSGARVRQRRAVDP